MPTRIQRDESTLKIMRDTKTGKVMRVAWDDCEFCDTGKTPRRLQAVFSDIEDCYCVGGMGTSYLPVGFAACVNGTHILDQYNLNACVWFNAFIPCSPKPDHRFYGFSEDCTGTYISSLYDDITINVARGETDVTVWVWCGRTGTFKTLFYGSSSDITNCVGVTVANETTCYGYTAPSFPDYAVNGSCVITEL